MPTKSLARSTNALTPIRAFRCIVMAVFCLAPLLAWSGQQAVKVAPIRHDPIDHKVSTFGVLAPQVEEISFSIAGRIEQFHVQEGQRVKAGQLIVELEKDDAREALSQAENALSKARRIVDQLDRLHASGSIQDSQLEDAKDQLYEAEISYQAAQLDLERCYLRSRSAGTILKQHIRSRTSVLPGESIFVFLSEDEPWVTKVELTDRNALMLSADTQVAVSFAPYPDQEFVGRVSRVAKVANPQDGLYTAEVTITPDGVTLLPGMVAELELSMRSVEPYFIVPLDAVLDLRGDKGTIYLASEDGSTAIERAVTIISVDDEHVALAEDLGEYTRVITHGQHGLSDQSPIRIVE